jgi:hypothetical protein
MGRGLRFIIIVGATALVSSACGSHAEIQNDPLSRYYQKLPTACQSEADCVIADVGNCCGHYPACVTKQKPFDRYELRRICEKESIGSVCGYPDVSGCRCVNGQCWSVRADGDAAFLNGLSGH